MTVLSYLGRGPERSDQHPSTPFGNQEKGIFPGCGTGADTGP